MSVTCQLHHISMDVGFDFEAAGFTLLGLGFRVAGVSVPRDIV